MEIRDPIHGSLEFIPPEEAVIESVAYQRLRAIKQLGFSEFSFPGATHNRFLHCLGVCHLAGQAFDSIFRGFQFSQPSTRWRFRQVLRLAALLHDIGHGPLSHTTEEAMPKISEIGIDVNRVDTGEDENSRANHEHYSVKIITGSELSEVLKQNFIDIEPIHVAALIDATIEIKDDFFIDSGLDFRPILSQLVSSELDADRMDYLERDAFYCGTSYGRVEKEWIIQNLSHHIVNGRVFLALNRRALYTFDDFLISRHHMHLIVYFHHKSIIYEEMLLRYLKSEDCKFAIPASIPEYMKFTDAYLYEHLKNADNYWAQRIAKNQPYRMLFEKHIIKKNSRVEDLRAALKELNFPMIHTNSEVRLSKYHSQEHAYGIYVVDQYDKKAPINSIGECTEIFRKYEEARIIERIYVPPEMFADAKEKMRVLDL